MAKAKIGELRNGLSRYLSRVKAGETITVYDRDTPIAEIVPLRPKKRSRKSDQEHLDSLERRGIIRRGLPPDPEWLKRWRPVKIEGESVLAALLEERESGW
jgi:antitoxin (DNA-binding transcriptional repressor) of toxin-antitoxin stability system